MKIIILEGIATSGKTSVKNSLIKSLNRQRISSFTVEEDKTLMPILENTDKKTSINFLKDIINKSLQTETSFLIFDRLYFTHIFRTSSSIEDFLEIEDMIKSESLLVLLEIDESRIPERIKAARAHRGSEWDAYVGTKGTDKEINEYYIQQQRFLQKLIKKTSLDNIKYNTTDQDFDIIANDILTLV